MEAHCRIFTRLERVGSKATETCRINGAETGQGEENDTLHDDDADDDELLSGPQVRGWLGTDIDTLGDRHWSEYDVSATIREKCLLPE